MLDIKFIRENPKEVQKGAKDKGIKTDINQLLDSDKKYRKLSESVQKLREEGHKAANKKNIEKGKEIKEKLDKQGQELRLAKGALDDLLLKIPNLPLKDVPVGDESKNKVIKKVGRVRKFDFKVRDHLELGELLDIIDVKRAAKVSGTRFGFLKNEAVLLEFALVQLSLDVLVKEGFILVIPPVLINQEVTQGLGYWHAPADKKTGLTGNEDYYLVSEPSERKYFYLVGTAEHAIVPMYKDEVLNKKNLPKRYVGFSPSFRREAGSYGKDTRGIFRVHQFDKVEMVSFTTEEKDDREHEYLLSLQEKLWQALEIPYRVVKMCTGDLGFPAARKYDLEVWIPSDKKYREVTSVSTTTDFQSRRLNIKYQEGSEKKFVHILNGTAFAIGRTIIAILENYQQKDGSVEIPKVLQKYVGKKSIKPQK